MKLSDLVDHTARSLNLGNKVVETYARFLRQDRAVTSTGKGGAAADMTDNDKLALLVAVCACGTARTAAHSLPRWLSLPFAGPHQATYSPPFKFLVQRTLKEALQSLFAEIASGAVEGWNITARFEIDREAASVVAARVTANKFDRIETRESHSAEFRTVAESSRPFKLVSEVDLKGLTAWGRCLSK
jgi:hypothetical protein